MNEYLKIIAEDINNKINNLSTRRKIMIIFLVFTVVFSISWVYSGG